MTAGKWICVSAVRDFVFETLGVLDCNDELIRRSLMRWDCVPVVVLVVVLKDWGFVMHGLQKIFKSFVDNNVTCFQLFLRSFVLQ